MNLQSLMLALDVDTKDQCDKWVHFFAENNLFPIAAFKLGPRMVLRYGSELIREVAKYAPVFVDMKFLDIPSTMEAAVRAAFDAGASYVTVHAWAGQVALRKLAQLELELQKSRENFKILVVTILTSFVQEQMPFPMFSSSIATQVEELAQMTMDCGLSGLVCSPHEVAKIRSLFPSAYLVTPGIRWQSSVVQQSATKDDQQRTWSPQEALQLGASAIVIGRPILQASDPKMALMELSKTLQNLNNHNVNNGGL